MPRRPRLFVSGGIYHVYCRTHRGELRFGEPKESESFVDTVSDVANTHELTILAWCLMSNHYHLVVQTSDVKLWRTMARIHGRVTRDHNRRHRVFGSSWEGRYRARLIQNSDDLRHLLAYVHLNPVVAGLTKDPADYSLSGHQEIMGRRNPLLVNVAASLRCFEEESPSRARVVYLDFIRCVAEAKWARTSVRGLPWWQPVKDDHQTVTESEAPFEARTFDDRHPELPPPNHEPIEILLERAASLLGLPAAEIRGRGKRAVTVEARRRFALIAVRFFDHSLKSIAQALGKSPPQVSRWLARETEAYASDREEAARVDAITATLLRIQQPSARGPTSA
jgi:putative transposase